MKTTPAIFVYAFACVVIVAVGYPTEPTQSTIEATQSAIEATQSTIEAGEETAQNFMENIDRARVYANEEEEAAHDWIKQVWEVMENIDRARFHANEELKLEDKAQFHANKARVYINKAWGGTKDAWGAPNDAWGAPNDAWGAPNDALPRSDDSFHHWENSVGEHDNSENERAEAARYVEAEGPSIYFWTTSNWEDYADASKDADDGLEVEEYQKFNPLWH